MWNDRGSGARNDVSVYEAVAGSDGHAVWAISVNRCHCHMDSTA